MPIKVAHNETVLYRTGTQTNTLSIDESFIAETSEKNPSDLTRNKFCNERTLEMSNIVIKND